MSISTTGTNAKDYITINGATIYVDCNSTYSESKASGNVIYACAVVETGTQAVLNDVCEDIFGAYEGYTGFIGVMLAIAIFVALITLVGGIIVVILAFNSNVEINTGFGFLMAFIVGIFVLSFVVIIFTISLSSLFS
jgi:hypothetical protein